ncbi:MAG: DUF4932 domain-containing protein, partial [Gemmatimonadetes bacterium]|nr:DUF4932 domain-containing protein [Gemmatimonadota bacterium]NIT66707.1 DUF4932 domain-containing protein [Gemmatimonadota bacterium]NIV23324.1 DUF4932 domain-containing protein [Gemmatimonadota bacterium]NIW75138.1 DUF4932 domain-containing protein [Gemmatimonadota bacterium]NIY35284.1 DUF4932 domain-containing protein [Gemmatimonadota bacterium]
KPAMVRQGYATWKSCMADHLARAFEVRYLCRREGPGAARRMLTVQTEQLGFRLLPVLHRQFVRYEASRDRYATFEDFFPEIVATLGRLEAVETRAPVPMGGFIDLDESNRG